MKWSFRPSCSLLPSLPLVTMVVTTTTFTTHSVLRYSGSVLVSTHSIASSAFCGTMPYHHRDGRPCRRIHSCSTHPPPDDRSSEPPRTTVPFTPYYTYTLGNHHDTTLYVPFTSYSNTRTLPQLRGPNFRLPPHVVAALCRVRDDELESRSCRSSSSSRNNNNNITDDAGDANDASTTTTLYQRKYDFWCQWLDTQESYQIVPPPLWPASYTARIPSDDMKKMIPPQEQEQQHRPTVSELLTEVQQWYDHYHYYHTSKSSNRGVPVAVAATTPTIVVAGEGEPTLRWDDLMRQFLPQLQQSIVQSQRRHHEKNANHHTPQIRLMTNGLLTSEQTQELLWRCRAVPTTTVTTEPHGSSLPPLQQLPVMTISVLFPSSDPEQYQDWMQPMVNDDGPTITPHDMVQQFIRTVADAIQSSSSQQQQHILPPQLSMEITAIDRPEVDQEALSKCVASLGVTTPIRWRAYFP